jgi:hypothetical protein
VALERRNGNLYYYRSVRDGEKVRKVYWGSGELARIAHEREIMNRAARQHERRESARELERLEALAAPVLELSEAAEILVRAHLIDAGYHRRKGEYRRARGEAKST